MPASTPELRIRTMQIIAAALMQGVVVFALLVVFLGALEKPSAGYVVSFVGIGLAGMSLIAHVVVPGLVHPQRSPANDSDGNEIDWYGLYQTRMIIGLAFLEGAAFLNLIACLLEHHWWSLAAAGVLLFWMLAAFPTGTRVAQWVETQQMQAARRY